MRRDKDRARRVRRGGGRSLVGRGHGAQISRENYFVTGEIFRVITAEEILSSSTMPTCTGVR